MTRRPRRRWRCATERSRRSAARTDIRALAGAGHPRHRSRRPHRHPRPDRFPHPRHPRRAFLHHRGALDRRPHAGRGARPHPRRGEDARRRARGSSSPAAGPSGSSRRTAARRRARSRPPRPIITSMSSSSTAACCSTPAAMTRSASRAIRTSPRASPSSSDKDGKPTGWLTGDNRAISDLFDLLPRPTFAQKVEGTRAFFRALNAVGLTGVIDPGGYNLSIPDYQPLFAGLARARADLARALQPVRAAPRPRARGLQGAHAAAADGLRRRLAALQRHRRERHLGPVQQRHADRRAEGRSLPRCCAGRSRAA